MLKGIIQIINHGGGFGDKMDIKIVLTLMFFCITSQIIYCVHSAYGNVPTYVIICSVCISAELIIFLIVFYKFMVLLNLRRMVQQWMAQNEQL